MSFSDDGPIISDNGGTRIGKDRRKLSIINRTPERRVVKDRRSGQDRRNSQTCRDGDAIERRDTFRSINTHIGYRQV